MIALLLLALALSMDAFAVAIGLGAKYRTHTLKIALMAGLYFGLAQGIMPLIGYLGGRTVLGFIADYAGWIGCIILVSLGVKMLYEAFKGGVDETETENTNDFAINHKNMFSLAIATSIDAMAAGFTLNLLAVNPYFACAIIALITGLFSFIGVFLGKQSGTWLESKAEIFGGIVLIGMGIKMVL